MNQLEILKNMTTEPWDMVTATRLEHQTGWNIMASVTAVNATYGAGILPSEVAEMKELLELFKTFSGGAGKQVRELLTRINERNNADK